MNKEKLQHHLKHLEERHAELEKKIKDGYSHYLDDVHLGKIKHEKSLLSVRLKVELFNCCFP